MKKQNFVFGSRAFIPVLALKGFRAGFGKSLRNGQFCPNYLFLLTLFDFYINLEGMQCPRCGYIAFRSSKKCESCGLDHKKNKSGSASSSSSVVSPINLFVAAGGSTASQPAQAYAEEKGSASAGGTATLVEDPPRTSTSAANASASPSPDEDEEFTLDLSEAQEVLAGTSDSDLEIEPVSVKESGENLEFDRNGEVDLGEFEVEGLGFDSMDVDSQEAVETDKPAHLEVVDLTQEADEPEMPQEPQEETAKDPVEDSSGPAVAEDGPGEEGTAPQEQEEQEDPLPPTEPPESEMTELSLNEVSDKEPETGLSFEDGAQEETALEDLPEAPEAPEGNEEVVGEAEESSVEPASSVEESEEFPMEWVEEGEENPADPLESQEGTSEKMENPVEEPRENPPESSQEEFPEIEMDPTLEVEGVGLDFDETAADLLPEEENLTEPDLDLEDFQLEMESPENESEKEESPEDDSDEDPEKKS